MMRESMAKQPPAMAAGLVPSLGSNVAPLPDTFTMQLQLQSPETICGT